MAVRKSPRPWVIKKGVDTDFILKFKNNDNTPVDITGYQFRTDVRYNVSDLNPIFTLSNGSGFTIVDGPNGELKLTISKDNAELVKVNMKCSDSTFPFENVYIDIEYYKPSTPNVWEAFLMGVIRVYEQVTRSN